MQIKIAKTVLSLQPLFSMPIYFSVLIGHPPLWLSMAIAAVPLSVRYGYTRSIFSRTPFDIPILVFLCGTLIGFIVAPEKGVATGTLFSTTASILVYYGITANSNASRRYWLWVGGIICLISFSLSLWFLSQSIHRVLFFNQWAFDLFATMPKTTGPVLQLNTIGALLAVVIPPLFTSIFLRNHTNLKFIGLMWWLFFTILLILCDSGAGWLAVIISLAFILVCWRQWLIYVFIPTGGLVASAVVMFYDKIDWLKITFSTSSLTRRIILWQNTLILLKGKSAVTGLGLGSWLGVYDSHYANTVAIVHNSYLQLYCDTGILGFIAMVLAAIIFIRLSRNILKLSRQDPAVWIGIGLIGSVIAGAIFATFDTTPTITYITSTGYIYLSLPLLWIGAALISVVNEQFLPHFKMY